MEDSEDVEIVYEGSESRCIMDRIEEGVERIDGGEPDSTVKIMSVVGEQGLGEWFSEWFEWVVGEFEDVKEEFGRKGRKAIHLRKEGRWESALRGA